MMNTNLHRKAISQRNTVAENNQKQGKLTNADTTNQQGKKVLNGNSISSGKKELSFKEKEEYLSLKLGMKVKYRALDYAKALVKSGKYTYEEAMSHIYDLQTQQQFFSNTKRQGMQNLVTDEEFWDLYDLFLRRCREQGCIRDISFIEMVSDLNKKKNAELHYRDKAPVAVKVEAIRVINGKGALTFDPKQRKEKRIQEVTREIVKGWMDKGLMESHSEFYTIENARQIATSKVSKEKLNNIYEDEEDRKMAQQIYNINNNEKQRKKDAEEGKVQYEKPGRPKMAEEEKKPEEEKKEERAERDRKRKIHKKIDNYIAEVDGLMNGDEIDTEYVKKILGYCQQEVNKLKK